MGLITSYTNRNKVTNNGLAIKYQVEPEYVLLSGSMTRYYRCTRFATKSYQYVGMDYTTARQCSQAKTSLYFRNYSIIAQVDESELSNGLQAALHNEYVKANTSNIAYTKQDGNMWNCTIDVNETDVKPSLTLPTDVASLFTVENARNYDEDTGSASDVMTLNSVVRSGTTAGVTYEHSIQDFNDAALMLQWSSTGGNWMTCGRVGSTYTGIPSSVINLNFRLIYGSITSNTVVA